MRSSFQFAAVVLLFMLSVAPAMPCVMAGAQVAAPTHACCHMMKTSCGHLRMPASSSCCHAEPGQNAPYAAINVTNVELRQVALTATAPYTLEAPSLSDASFAQAGTLPPLLPPRTLSVLRI
ncbi:MAG: hypothetical protein P4L10_02380 [Acidobacteriaceae bacterium]|jgi:hypothetical protein|nr:hypothetical protein [Acidobacteriaceae bacterium]